jgi:membrane fusion protein (multidrug efflux system)
MNFLNHSLRAPLLTVSFLCLLQSCKPSKGNPEENKIEAEVPTTEVISLRKDKLASAIQIPGELAAFQQVDLYAKVTSFVKKLYVDLGSEVKEGQLLVTLEAPEMTSQLATAESRLKSQEAVYTASKANYERFLETSKTPGTISQNDLDQALSKRNSDYSQLEAARSIYKEISTTQNYLEIRAPFDGIITLRNVNPGAYVGPAGKGSEYPLMVLQEQKKLRLIISVPEIYTSYIKPNDQVHFTVTAFPSQKFSARVKRKAGALDNRLRSERVEMDVVNENKKLLPGMIAEVIVDFSSKDSTYVVPKSAVLNSASGVFVIKVEDGKNKWVSVQLGREAKGVLEIFGNLSPKDMLVKAASEEVRDGSPAGKSKPVDY